MFHYYFGTRASLQELLGEKLFLESDSFSVPREIEQVLIFKYPGTDVEVLPSNENVGGVHIQSHYEVNLQDVIEGLHKTKSMGFL